MLLQTDLKYIDMKLLKGEEHDRWMNDVPEIRQFATGISEAGDIAHARAAFKRLSDKMILLAKRFGSSGKQPVLVYHCPMAFDNRGADWLQNKEGTENPYFGNTMFRCGSQKQNLTFGHVGNAGEQKHE